ncbi:MAG: TOBE domain-containing protein, partial [Gemmatimonadota bacterium]|nr:TOBE domain-containing protein [Gemmatimonadota bacterium]
AATVMVRPERLRLTSQAPADGRGVPVTVEHAVFQGPVVRCTLRAADGTGIVAHVGPEQSLPPLEPGLPLWIGWDLDAGRLLPPDRVGADAQPFVEADLRHTMERASMPRL